MVVRFAAKRWSQASAVLGAVLGPVAYAGAERLGSVQLAEDAYGWLALEWGILMMGCSWLALGWADHTGSGSAQNS